MLASDLEKIFNEEFCGPCNTLLRGGAEEPVYLPADGDQLQHRILYRDDYFASGLHEVAHWCVAGERRRRLVDYGYWYVADGRNEQQQQGFEAVEAKPQALEWIFSNACNYRFRPSNDNLSGPSTDSSAFKQAIYGEALRYCRSGLPHRAHRFRMALTRFYATAISLEAKQFDYAAL